MKHASFGARSALVAVITALALQACGGGGGSSPGGGTPTPTPPVETGRNAPLHLGAGHLQDYGFPNWAQYALNVPFRVAQQAIKEVQTLARTGLLQMDQGCAHYALADNDRNGVISAGDVLKIEYRKCMVYHLSDTYTGTITIKLTAVENAAKGAVSGTVDLGDGLKPNEIQYTTWYGSLDFRRVNDLSQEQVEVSSSAADDLRTTLKDDVALKQESYQRFRLTRTQRRDTARTSLSGSMSWASDRFGGRIEISFDPQLSGYLNAYYDTGKMRLTGAANARITLSASPRGTELMTGELDSDGDGKADSTQALKWDYLVMGRLTDDESQGTPQDLDESKVRLVYQPVYNHVTIGEPLRFQFDRPLRADSVLQARLIDLGSAGMYEYPDWNGFMLSNPYDVRRAMGTTVEVRGALLLIHPDEVLQYGHTYQLLVSNIGDYQSSQSVVLRAADGTASVNLNVQLLGFQTDNALWIGIQGAGYKSVVMPGRPANVQSVVPNALNLPLRYQWTQISGPRVTFSAADAANTQVQWAAGETAGVDHAVLQLTVTDALGHQSSERLEMQVANLSGAESVLYFSGAPDSDFSPGQTRVFTSSTGTFGAYNFDYLTVRYDESDHRNAWSLDVSDENGQVPAPGTYANAVSMRDPASHRPYMNFSGGGSGCTSVGSFKVLERELASDGRVLRLAIDFEQRCLNSNRGGPVHGSLRFNSSLPIQL